MCIRDSPYYLYRQKYMSGNLENVGFALPGQECIYNIDIMEETVSNLAFGAGAISKRLFTEKNLIERAPNVKDLKNYIDRTEETVSYTHLDVYKRQPLIQTGSSGRKRLLPRR